VDELVEGEVLGVLAVQELLAQAHLSPLLPVLHPVGQPLLTVVNLLLVEGLGKTGWKRKM